MKHYVGEYGTALILDTGVALASATSVKIKYQKPDGTSGEWTGSVYGTTQVRYLLQSTDITIAGRWQFQAYAVFASGTYYGETIDQNFAELFDENVLCGLQTVKGLAHQAVTVTDDDAQFESLISQETKLIQNECGRTFFYGTFTEYHNGNGTDKIFTDEMPIDTVTSVHDDVDRAFGASVLIASTDYYIKQSLGIIYLLDGLIATQGTANIKVVYTGGYKVIPKDLELACAKRVLANYLEIKGGINVMEGETVVYKPMNLRKEAQKIIDLYRKVRCD